MSLRSRLLIAIGVIAVVALAVADVVTYSSLQSFLYKRVDQQLEQGSSNLVSYLNHGNQLTASACAGPGPFFPGGGGPGEGGPRDYDPSNAVQVFALEVRNGSGAIVNGQSCAVYVDDKAYSPQIPVTVSRLSTTSATPQETYFVAPSSQAGGPPFRVRAAP